MIHVACEACGASFNARDELAGRRGKCPSCGEGIVVPAEAEEAELETGAPVAAPVVSSRARGGARHRASAARGRSSSRKSGSSLGVMIGVGGILIAILAYFVMKGGVGAADAGLANGIDALSRNDYDAAIAYFESVPADSPTYAEAQGRISEVRTAQEKGDSVRYAAEAGQRVGYLDQLREMYVDRGGNGFTKPDYSSNTRYLLKRAAEFVRDFPEHPRAQELAGWPAYYAKVASLDTPPSEPDVHAELKFRFMGEFRDYKACMQVINEFAAASTDNDATALALRGKLQEQVKSDWNVKKVSKLDPIMEAGTENWQKVANESKAFIETVEAAPGLTVPSEARQLLALAESKPIGS